MKIVYEVVSKCEVTGEASIVYVGRTREAAISARNLHPNSELNIYRVSA